MRMVGVRREAAVAMAMAAAVVAVSVVLQGSVAAAAATKHVVGGSTGWTIPPNASFYSDWASSESFAAGDTLVFNFPTGIHNVVPVAKSAYDGCSTQGTVGATLTAGPATVTLKSAGAHYFICGVPTHCSFGQKLAVTVSAAAGAAPASSPSPSPSPSKSAPATPPGGAAPAAPEPPASPSSEPTAPGAAPPRGSSSAAAAPSSSSSGPAVWLLALLAAAAAGGFAQH